MTETIVLPFPVSVNGMYKNVGKRRAKSQRYRVWRDAALWAIRKQYSGGRISENIMLQIALKPPCNRARDLDNHAKAIQDALTGLVIHDDSQIKLLAMWWEDKVKGGEARVTIDRMDGQKAQSFLASFDRNDLSQATENAIINKQPDGVSDRPAKPIKSRSN